MEFIVLSLSKIISWSSPRRPQGRLLTVHLLRWQLVDITQDNK